MMKKKILMLSDDCRMFSGVATQSKEIIFNTIHKYDWCQLAGAIKHPDLNKIIDMNGVVSQETGVEDAYLKIYPTNGYGNSDLLRELLERENPDAILHYTDPRFWGWLYQMEHEIRQNIPILYYSIWDNLPDPEYNKNYYKCSDLHMCISKQTYGIYKRMMTEFEDWQIKYIPHGISEKRFYKVDKDDMKLKKFEYDYGLNSYKFKLLYISRNIRRKQPGDTILAYKHFMDSLTKEQQKDCVLIFHTAPVDENGTDLRAVCDTLIPDYNVVFTYDKGGAFDDEKMNYLFNSVDVCINLASNEGWGLGTTEALKVGTPIIVNVTGGLQDQCGFEKDGKYLTEDDYIELGSNHRCKYIAHGEWVKPVCPSNISLQGSPPTPYIFDDRCQYEDAGDAIKYWYDMDDDERERRGELGRKFAIEQGFTGEGIGKRFIKAMDTAFENWKPRDKYILEVV